MTPFDVIARLFGLAYMASARPLITIFLAQMIALLAVKLDWATLASDRSFLIGTTALVLGFVLASVETIGAHIEEVDEILRDARLHRFTGIIATGFGTVLLMSMGAPVHESVVTYAGATGSELSEALQVASQSGRPFHIQVVAALGATVASQFLQWLRDEVLEYLQEAGLANVWNVIESAGLPLLALIVIFSPLLILIVAIVGTLMLAAAAGIANLLERSMDSRRRRPCPVCATRIREEASLCLSCGAAVAPQRTLGDAQVSNARRQEGSLAVTLP